MSRQTRQDWFSSRKNGKPARRIPRHRRTLGVQPLEARRLLAVITVDTVADTIDFNDGQTSLREAVFAANTVPGTDTIEFAASLYEQSPATILLTQGEIAITDALEILGPGYRKLTIDASGSDTNLETSGSGSRIFNIDDRTGATIEVTLRGLTLTGGDSNANGGAVLSRERLSVDGVVFEKNQSRGGGAIAQSGAVATITNSQFLDNVAFSFGRGGALSVDTLPTGQALVVSDSQFSRNSAGQGGAIAVSGGRADSGAAVFERVSVTENLANSGGGGISLDSSSTLQATIRDSSISGNTAQLRGGGISATSVGSLAIENSKILDNVALPGTRGGSGGGAYFTSSNVSILGSTISGNDASAGGGLFNRMGELSIRFSEISANMANGGRGGGIYSERSRLSIVGSEVTGNTAAGVESMGGGGIWMSAAMGANPVIADTRIEGNTATRGNGGGIEFRTGYEGPTSPSLVLTGVTVAHNTAMSGGGVYVFGTSSGQLAPGVQITGGAIVGNEATSAAGGGLFSTLPSIQIDGTTISENTAWGSGGGVAIPQNATGPGQIIISNATFQENIASAEFDGSAAPGDGGAVWIAAPMAVVSINNSRFTSNSANRGGAIFRQAGGIANTLSIIGSTLNGNTASAAGGAVYNERGALVIDRSTIESNTTSSDRAQPGAGGGVHNRMADLTITTSSISGNSATGRGGGLYHNQGDLTISNTTIANNSSNADGGGVYAITTANLDRIQVQSSTVSGNDSPQTGGMYLRGHTTIRHSTIARNSGGGTRAGGVVAGDGSSRFELDHTIVAENSVGESAGSTAPDLRMYLPMFNVFVRNSLIGDGRGTTLVEAPLGSPDANGNLIGKSTTAGGSGAIDPLLGTLFVNGGPTLTHALLPGSPALDAGTLISGTPLGYDQRGNPYHRAVDASYDGVNNVRIDMGAYESQGMPRFTTGDFNRDGVVDACDYSIWRETFGTKITPLAGADANGNGIVDQSDYNLWKSNFGKGVSLGGRGAVVAAAEIVEPAEAVEPATVAARESGLPPRTLPEVIRSVNARRAAQRARLAAAPTDQILAQWSAAQSRALARRLNSAALDVGEDKLDDSTQDGTAALDMAFAAIAPF